MPLAPVRHRFRPKKALPLNGGSPVVDAKIVIIWIFSSFYALACRYVTQAHFVYLTSGQSAQRCGVVSLDAAPRPLHFVSPQPINRNKMEDKL